MTLTCDGVAAELFDFARVAGRYVGDERQERIDQCKLEMLVLCLKADFCWDGDLKRLDCLGLMLDNLIDADISAELKKSLQEIRTVF